MIGENKYYKEDGFTLYCGRMEEVLKSYPDNHFDSCVTDPPYGLRFMGKKWDYDVPSVEQWKEVYRVLKPGAFLLAFGGTRTYHRMVVNIEDAGFEIRDQIQWIYGSGFPKSLDVSKAIDKMKGAGREVIGQRTDGRYAYGFTEQAKRAMGDIAHAEVQGFRGEMGSITVPATPEALQWEGWGTALKPANEPICLARKPLSEKNVALNVLKWGTGGINVDGSRIGIESRTYKGNGAQPHKLNAHGKGDTGIGYMDGSGKDMEFTAQGRFPANVIHDGSEEVVGLFPQSAGQQGDVRGTEKSRTGDKNSNCYGEYGRIPTPKRNDSGSAARFFYCAKASKMDRDEGLLNILPWQDPRYGKNFSSSDKGTMSNSCMPRKNNHPTVKPTALMAYLCRLITPPGGIILDPFAGTFSTGKGCVPEGFRFVGIDDDEKNCAMGVARIRYVLRCIQGELQL